MKKRISMLLACAMMLALASCGGNNGNNSGNAGNQSNAGGNTSGSTGVNSSASTSQGGGAADPPRGTGDDGHAAVEGQVRRKARHEINRPRRASPSGGGWRSKGPSGPSGSRR